MSEKRHATLDAKSTDTYQRNKKLREERDRQKQQQGNESEKTRNQRLAEERNLQGMSNPHYFNFLHHLVAVLDVVSYLLLVVVHLGAVSYLCI